jgi:predicted phosphoribosyltransferase
MPTSFRTDRVAVCHEHSSHSSDAGDVRLFRNRSEAGRLLAAKSSEYANRDDVLVLALPRGGVPVAAEIAAALGSPLDVLVVRKIGVPWNPEFGVGAVASGGMMVPDVPLMRQLGLARADLEPVIREEELELRRRESLSGLVARFRRCRARRQYWWTMVSQPVRRCRPQ